MRSVGARIGGAAGLPGLLAAMWLAGCGHDRRQAIAFIPQATAVEMWESAHAGAIKAAYETERRLYWNGPSRPDDFEQQIALIDRATREGYGGILLAPDHGLALNTAIRRAQAKGIPMVVLGSRVALQPGPGLAYVLNDEQAMGQLAAERVGWLLHGRGRVAALGVNRDVIGIVERSAAFEQALAKEYPGITLVESRAGSFNLSQAEQDAEDMLMANPKLDAIVGLNNTAARGAYIALKTTHRFAGVKLLGCEQDLDLFYYLRRGEIDSIVTENSFAMGFTAVKTLEAEMSGHAVEPLVRLKPVLVTLANVDTPEVQQMLTANLRPQK